MTAALWGTLTLVVIIAWLRINKHLFNDLLSPFNLLLIGWIGPLLLSRTRFSSWQRPWSWEVTLLLAWVTFALIITSVVFNVNSCRIDPASSRIVFAKTVRLFQNRRFLALVFLLFLISFVAFIKNEFIDNPIGIPLIAYLRNPNLQRGTFHLWGNDQTADHYSRVLSGPAYLLVAMLYFAIRVNTLRRIRLPLMLFVAAYAVLCVLKLSRVDMTFVAGAIIFVEYYYRKLRINLTARRRILTASTVRKWVWRTVLGGVIAFIGSVGLNFFQQVRGGLADPHQLGQGVGIYAEVPEALYGLVIEGYAYFALPFENFVEYYETYTGGYNVGIGFFRPFLSIVGQGAVADRMLSDSFAPLFGFVNTAPFIAVIYVELGLVGLAIVPIIYGLFVNVCYIRFRASPGLASLFIYITVSIPWMFLFATDGFSVVTCYLNILFFVILQRIANHFFGGGRVRPVRPNPRNRMETYEWMRGRGRMAQPQL